MTQWVAFASVTGVVLAALVLLAHASKQLLDESVGSEDVALASDGREIETAAATEDEIETAAVAEGETEPVAAGEDETETAVTTEGASDPRPATSLSSATLLVNVAFTQGLFGAVIVAGAWYARIPPDALGLGGVSTGLALVGVALGVGLYLGNEGLAALADGVGVEYSEKLREALAPDSAFGWGALLLVVLPIVAGFEELLFRAALIGALSAGFGVSPWLLAVVSTLFFAIGHGVQGPAGIAVTGVLGFALAAAFIITGSLLTVIVAHYLVNALEFVVHEGLNVEWV